MTDKKINRSMSRVVCDRVSIEHHSTSSIYEVTVKERDEDTPEQKLWLDYAEMDMFLEAMTFLT